MNTISPLRLKLPIPARTNTPTTPPPCRNALIIPSPNAPTPSTSLANTGRRLWCVNPNISVTPASIMRVSSMRFVLRIST